jgi:preprotein translocase subunit SecY
MILEEDKNLFVNDIDFSLLTDEQRKNLSKKPETQIIFTKLVRERLITTTLLIFVIKFGMAIPLPYIDQSKLAELSGTSFVTTPIELFIKSNRIANLFALGIGPSINASIIIQLFLVINPNLKKMQREEGEFGRRKISQYSRYLTLFLAIFQSIILVFSLRSYILDWNIEKLIELSCFLTTGAMIILWISECITKAGITNGSSFLVFLNIVNTLPQQFQLSFQEFNFLSFNGLILVGTLFFTISSATFLQQTVKNIPLLNSKVITGQFLSRGVNKFKTYLPTKLNQAGVMPVVFASYLLPVLKIFVGYLFGNLNTFNIVFPQIISQILEFILICLFSIFYSVLIIDPKDVSEDLKKSSFFIPGIRPGRQTFNYLQGVFQRQAIIGGIILGINALLINFVELSLNIPILKGFGIGSQIILIGVVTDVIQKIKGLLFSDIYKRIRNSY